MPPKNPLNAMNPLNAPILRITAAAGTELVAAYSAATLICLSLIKELYNQKTFFTHAVLLGKACAH